MKHILATVMVLAFAIAVATYREAASSPMRTWLPLAAGIVLIAAAILAGLSLRLPRLGRWFLGRMWPEQYADGKQKRIATGCVFGLLLAYLLWGSGMLLSSLDSSSPLWSRVESTMTVLGALGVCATLWLQAVLVRRGG
jgi:hypothetical protein